MDWYEEPINPECAPKGGDAGPQRSETMAEMLLRSMNGTLTDEHVDFYTQRFMRKD